MTMAWTAPTGLGPGTVALSLKVFIVVMFYTHERIGICTAQPGNVLPLALRMNRENLIEHFCTSGQRCGGESGRPNNCEHDQLSPNPLCLQICNYRACNANCWRTAGTSLCTGNQIQLCGYSNADVCQSRNGDRTRTCVYTSDSSPAFCICQRKPSTPYTRCDPRDTAERATTERATIVQAATAQAATAQAATERAITAQATAARSYTTDQPINAVGIVLGSMFALLLLLVIIGAVTLYLHTQGRLPSFVKQESSPTGLSSVELEARSSTRALPPEPSVPGSSISYAYDHIPAMLGAKADPNQGGPTYCSVGEDGHREGNPRYVLDRQRKIPTTKELDTSMDNAKDHPYFVLNNNVGADEEGRESGGGSADGDEATVSSVGVQAKEDIDKEYTPLVLTGHTRSRTEQCGNEVAVSPTSSKKPPLIDSPTVGLSNGDAGTYFPLILSAEPKSQHMEQSGYEDAKILTSESHDATSPTGAQSKSYDNGTYTPLIRTADPKSQKKRSDYEVPIIPKPGLAADDDVTSPYDHLDRQRENDPKEGALSFADRDDY